MMTLRVHYGDLVTQKYMLRDYARGSAFQLALNQMVKRGSAVLDVGAGTGLLSIFAAQAGARAVCAVERTSTAELARQIIRDNGLSDVIQVFEHDVLDVELPEQFDVIVSEFMGGCGVDEGMLPAVLQARDRWLKPSGCMIPYRLAVWLAPVYDDLLDADVRYWSSQPYGVDLNSIGQATVLQMQPCRHNVLPQHVLCPPQKIWDLDLMSMSYEESLKPLQAQASFVFSEATVCNALAAWFDAYLAGDCVLSNRPSYDYSHWGRWVVPIAGSFSVPPGETIDFRLEVEQNNHGKADVRWSGRLGSHEFCSSDLTELV